MANWWLEIDASTNVVINAYEREDGDDPHALPDVITMRQADSSVGCGYIYDPVTQTFAPPTVETIAPPPPSSLEWMQRFTMAERTAIRSSTDAQVQDFLFLAMAAQTIDTSLPEVQQGVGYLVQLGLLTQDRASAILA